VAGAAGVPDDQHRLHGGPREPVALPQQGSPARRRRVPHSVLPDRCLVRVPDVVFRNDDWTVCFRGGDIRVELLPDLERRRSGYFVQSCYDQYLLFRHCNVLSVLHGSLLRQYRRPPAMGVRQPNATIRKVRRSHAGNVLE